MIEVLHPEYWALGEDLDEMKAREADLAPELRTLEGRIEALAEKIATEVKLRARALGSSAKQAGEAVKEARIYPLRKYVAARLNAGEIEWLSQHHSTLNVYAVWRSAQKRKFLHRSIDHIFRMNNTGAGLQVHGVNLSLGGPFDASVYGCGYSPICKELRDLWRQGVLVCVAAGNEGQIRVRTDSGKVDLNAQLSIGDPANLDDCIAVGSVNADKPHLYGVSYFSSRGPTADGRRKPDVVAPGERIESCNSEFLVGDEETLYRADSGTSMACPHVSGLLAAFLSVRREYRGRPDEVKGILLDNCNDLDRDPYHQGAGMPNLMKMLLNT